MKFVLCEYEQGIDRCKWNEGGECTREVIHIYPLYSGPKGDPRTHLIGDICDGYERE